MTDGQLDLFKAHASLPTSTSPVVETLERIRLTANLGRQDWLDILGVQWRDYLSIKAGTKKPSDKIIENVAQHFGFTPSSLQSGEIDFKKFAIEQDDENCGIHNYLKAAFGRRRTSITSLDWLEDTFGWRLRMDALRALNVSEAGLNDAFAPISINFITDLCAYLSRRQFRSLEFYSMGANAYYGNKNTILAKIFSELRSTSEIFEFFCSEAIKLYEQNCIYKIISNVDSRMTIEISTNPHVAAETGKKYLGSKHVCDVKRGLISHLPCYLNLPAAVVIETACVHRGASACRFEVDYSAPEKVRLTRLSS